MKIWIQKAIVQKLISFLPFNQKINFLFQKYVTKGVYLTDAYFEDKILHLHKHLSFFKRYTGKDHPGTTLELGTGWYPIIPAGMYLCGCTQNVSIDISSLTHKKNILLTLSKFVEWYERNKKSALPVIPERIDRIRSIVSKGDQMQEREILTEIGLKLIVGDARSIDLEDGSIDLITSNNTLEHIYPSILKNILTTFYRKLRPGGLMSHSIDMSDHFAHLDKSITIYNFLRFSAAEWRWIDNAIQPQNRLRISQYKEIYSQLNIPVTHEEQEPGDMKALKSIQLSDEFSSISPECLAVSHCSLVSQLG